MSANQPFEVQITFEPNPGFLFVKTIGALDTRSLQKLFTASAAAAQTHKCTRLFVDHRASEMRLNATEIYNLPADLANHGLFQHRAALLFTEVGSDEHFLEVVCANRNVATKVFTEQDKALAWLTSPTGDAIS